MAGRDSLHDAAMWRWADEGEAWLRENFGNTLDFHTMVDANKRTVTLRVYKKLKTPDKVSPENVGPGRFLWAVTEPIQNFVSHHTTTKIILIA